MVECYNFVLLLTDFSFIGSSDSRSVTADAPNKLLSELLFEQLKQIHGKELQLTLEDCMWFLQLLHARERDGAAYSLPVPLPLPHHQAKKKGGSCHLKNLDSIIACLMIVIFYAIHVKSAAVRPNNEGISNYCK
jgi:hypothetical protein